MKKLLLAAIVALTAMPAGAEIRNFDFRYYVSSSPDTSLIGTYQYGRFSYDDQILPAFVNLQDGITGFSDSSIKIGLFNGQTYGDVCGSLCSMTYNSQAVEANGDTTFAISVYGSFGQQTFLMYGGTVGFSGLAVPTGFAQVTEPRGLYLGVSSGQIDTAAIVQLPFAVFSYGPAQGVGEPDPGRTGGFADFAEPDVSPAPEPAIWAMLASGLAITGGAARRRKAQPLK